MKIRSNLKFSLSFCVQTARHHLLALLFLFITWLAYIFPYLDKKYSFAIWLDNEAYFSPIFSRMSNILSQGQWPDWLPHFLGGVPYYNNPQFTPYYPFYFLFSDWFSTRTQTQSTVHLLILLHYLIFLLNSYIMLQVIGVSRLIATLGATLIVFNQNIYQLSSWLTIIASYSWLPLSIATAIRLMQKPSKMNASLFLTAIGFIVLACPAQNLIQTLYMCFCLMLGMYFAIKKNLRVEIAKRLLVSIKIPILFFVALMLPVVLPIFTNYSNLIRWTGNLEPQIGGDRLSYEAFTQDQFQLKDLIGVIVKKMPVTPSGDLYLGVIPILLVVVGLVLVRKNVLFQIFLFIAVYSLVSSFGSNLGLSNLNYELPLINMIRQPVRFITLFHISAIVCACISFDALVERFKSAKFYERLPRLSRHLFEKGIVGFALVTLLIWFQHSSVPLKPPTVSASDFVSQNQKPLDDALAFIAKVDPEKNYRSIFLGELNPQTSAMLASFRDLRSVTAYFNPAPYKQFQDIYFLDLKGSDALDLYSVKYIVCKACSSDELTRVLGNSSTLTPIYDEANVRVYLNSNAQPLIYFADSILGAADSFDDALKYFRDESKKYTLKGVSIDTNQRPLISSNNCTLSSKSLIGREWTVKYVCVGSGLLVVNEYFDRNWKASVNDQPLEQIRINALVNGFLVPDGNNLLSIRYVPSDKWNYLKVSCLIVFVLLVYKLTRCFSRKTKTKNLQVL